MNRSDEHLKVVRHFIKNLAHAGTLISVSSHILHMANITISIPEGLRKKMKRHSEIKWSEVVRKALTNYVDQLEVAEGGVVSAETLSQKLKEEGADVSTIDLDKAIEYYEEGRKLERKRLSMIQANL